MEKPVIILGDGLLGSLLAYRLRQVLPEIEFKLYEQSSVLGGFEPCSFRSSDCESSLPWLSPLISQSWESHHIKFNKFEKWITDPYHLIDSRRLNEVLKTSIGPDIVKLNNEKSLELALQESSFVIDTRNICHYKKKGFRKHLILEMELVEDHHLIAPVLFNAGVDRKDTFRTIRYFPLSSKKLILKDFWFSENNHINTNEMRNAAIATIGLMGWKIKKVIREDFGISDFPLSSPIIPQEGRVVSLAGIFHDTTGSSMPLITKLVDRMVKTSFRFGELREVVLTFKNENAIDKKFFQFLNKLMIEDRQEIFEAVYQQPYPVLERFSRGELTMFDRSRILFGKSGYQIKKMMNLILPYSTVPPVHLAKPE